MPGSSSLLSIIKFGEATWPTYLPVIKFGQPNWTYIILSISCTAFIARVLYILATTKPHTSTSYVAKQRSESTKVSATPVIAPPIVTVTTSSKSAAPEPTISIPKSQPILETQVEKVEEEEVRYKSPKVSRTRKQSTTAAESTPIASTAEKRAKTPTSRRRKSIGRAETPGRKTPSRSRSKGKKE